MQSFVLISGLTKLELILSQAAGSMGPTRFVTLFTANLHICIIFRRGGACVRGGVQIAHCTIATVHSKFIHRLACPLYQFRQVHGHCAMLTHVMIPT